MGVETMKPEELVRRAIACQKPRASKPLGICVMDTFGMGLTYSRDLCRLYGFNPDARKPNEMPLLGARTGESKPGPVAPWPDFAGNPIHDKDRIRHPDGTTGTVLHLPALGEGGEAWRVVYEDGCLSRLSLQIGDKGCAVVIPLATTKGES